MLECPHCHAQVDPAKCKRVDGQHLQCPWCDGRFVPGGEKAISTSIEGAAF
jgi:Zn-finger nucleic acid-binding protein